MKCHSSKNWYISKRKLWILSRWRSNKLHRAHIYSKFYVSSQLFLMMNFEAIMQTLSFWIHFVNYVLTHNLFISYQCKRCCSSSFVRMFPCCWAFWFRWSYPSPFRVQFNATTKSKKKFQILLFYIILFLILFWTSNFFTALSIIQDSAAADF